MSIINKLAGFYGYTCDNTTSSTDSKGEVNKCIIVLSYPLQPNDVDVTISTGSDDWAVRMGDESIIPCSNPNILYVNRDNCVVEFTMSSSYPSNSPCSLVFRSDSASFSLSNRWTSRSYTQNTASGHWAFTIDAYNSSQFTVKDYTGSADRYVGLVNKVLATFPFPYQKSQMQPVISTSADHWGARMGNGDIIPLQDPQIVSVNQDSFIVAFTMQSGYSYPSNSPCLIVYRSVNASIDVTAIDDDKTFHNVTSLFDYPTKMISGESIDLNCVKVNPYNATRQNIIWTINSGNGEIVDSHFLHATNGGSVSVKATIKNALNDKTDYTFSFTVAITQNVITIVKQPSHESTLFTGNTPIAISVLAKSLIDEVSYQWYSNTNNSTSGATIISGETNSEYTPPVTTGVSNIYYFCKISSDGAADVYSNICHVYIKQAYTGIQIINKISSINMYSNHQLDVQMVPSTALTPEVMWESSDSDILKVSSTGYLTSNVRPGEVTITVRTKSDPVVSNSCTITVNDIVPVTDIQMDLKTVNINGSYTLNPTVVPANATNSTIVWSILNKGTTGLTLSNGVIKTTATGTFQIRATIAKGSSLDHEYTKDFTIRALNNTFNAVTDVIMNTDTSTAYALDAALALSWTISPNNATNSSSYATLISGPGTLSNGKTLTFTGGGNVVIRITVTKGASTTTDFTKDFTFVCTGTNEARSLTESFIEVTNIELAFPNNGNGEFNYWDAYNSNPMLLPYNIIPSGATNTATTITVTGIKSKVKPDDVISGATSKVEDSTYWTTGTWDTEDKSLVSINASGQISCDITQFQVSRYYVVSTHFVVKNGASKTTDFTKDLDIIISTESKTPFIPLNDFDIILPSKLRAYVPILIATYTFDPDKVIEYNYDNISDIDYQSSITCTDVTQLNDWNYTKDDDKLTVTLDSYKGSSSSATVYGKYTIDGTTYSTKLKSTTIQSGATIIDELNTDMITITPDRPLTEEQVVTQIYKPTDYDIYFGVTPMSIIDWEKPTLYCLPYNGGALNVTIRIYDAIFDPSVPENKFNPTKYYIEKYFEMTVLDPFIAVKDITINCDHIDTETDWVITPTLDTQGGTNYYNPCWDEDTPSNTKIEWSGIIKTGSYTAPINFTTGPNNSIIINTDSFTGAAANMLDYTSKDGENAIVLTATIKEGTQEEFTWYDKSQSAIDYVKTFSLPWQTEKSITDYIGLIPNVILITLSDGNTYGICQQWQIEMLRAMSADKAYNLIYSINPENMGWISCKSTDITAIEFIENPTSSTHLGTTYDPITITSLKNFGRGLTNLTKITGKIPSSVTGDNCFEGFLEGCTSLNCEIDFSNATAEGTYQFKNALKGCTKLNSKVTLPSSLTGEGCLYGFMTNCTSFNQSITIPSTVTGDKCLKFFMNGCSVFNQSIAIPTAVSGRACLMGFMGNCKKFNQPLTLPNDLGKYVGDDGYLNGMQLSQFLENCDNYCSTITATNSEGVRYADCSERTFGCFNWDSPLIQNGITIDGDGASMLCKYLRNNYELDSLGRKVTPPWVHVTNLD